MGVDAKIYLGTGLKLPIELINGAGRISVGQECVEDSIMSILSTPLGTRLFLEDYGSRTEELAFEQNDDVLKGMLRLFIFEALIKWEKRAKFTDVEFVSNDLRVDCIIYYRLLSSNQINSFIYPFYKKLIH